MYNINPYVVPGLNIQNRTGFKMRELRVLERFCKINGCTVEQIKGKRRFKELVAVRQSFCKWATENTNLSLAVIGHLIGKDHATVLHSARTANNRLDVKDKLLTPIYSNCLATL